MGFNIEDFQSKGAAEKDPVSECRSPKVREDCYVLADMFAANVKSSRLRTSKNFLIGPEPWNSVHLDDRRVLNLQVVALRNGLLACFFDPKRSKLGDAFGQAKDKWVNLEYVHADRAYRVSDAAEQGPPPECRYKTLGELIEKEFADRIVDRNDHPALLTYLRTLRVGK